MWLMRIDASEYRCVGAGQCVRTAPEVFDQDDDGVVVVRTPEPVPEQRALVREAVYLCPASAISLDESRQGDDLATTG